MRNRISQSILGVVFVFTTLVSFSQIPIGTWRAYMPYTSSMGICDAGDLVYSAGVQSVFSYEKNTGAIRIYDKSTGLNDVGIKMINYDAATKALVIAYTNSNIDLVFNGTDVYNIPDIKKKSITGAILINDISFYNGKAYLSTTLGISVIDLAKKEVGDTYVIGKTGGTVAVYGTTVDGVTIYAATEEGAKAAPFNSSNLQDFNLWTVFPAQQGLPVQKIGYIAAYNNKIYAVAGKNNTDTIYEYNGSTWDKIFFHEGYIVQSLEVVNNTLYFTTWDANQGAGQLGTINQTGPPTLQSSDKLRPVNWFEYNGIAWFGDGFNGLFKRQNGSSESITPDGPFSSNVFRLDVKNGVVNVAAGGVDDSWGFTYNRDGFFTFKDNKWSYTNGNSNPSLYEFSDILCADYIPARQKSYYGSFYSGLIEVDHANNDRITLYDKTNSPLEGVVGDSSRIKISCLFTDSYNNLWMCNAGAPSLLKVLTADNQWKKFTIPYSIGLFKKLIVDQQNQVWALTRQTNGVLVFGYGEDMDNTADDVSRLLRPGAGAGGLPDENVFSLAEDLDGNIWIGTNQGIGIYYCAASALTETGCDADQIKVVAADGYVGYLFGTESVRAIAVDAANRKWIGTTNGLWLISADGQTQLLNFNATNSPMPSSQVTDIAIDNTTGEVFIGTLGGLVSYQGDAPGECTDCGDGALVYPNPVKPEYDGPIAIKNLTSNAYVKITDITGALAYQGRANGTQMVWDGKNYNGVRVRSGVYLVFSSTDLGKEKKVAKILVMN